MKMSKSLVLATYIILIFLSLGIALYFYPRMPERMASHWDIRGQVDGYLSKFWGLSLLPTILVGLIILFRIIPRIDPLRRNFTAFEAYYHGYALLLALFLSYLYLLTLLWNMGKNFSMIQLITPALSVFFYYLGVLLRKVKRNWFIGMRTPWTLTSDRVWDKTHATCGRLLKLAGLFALLGIIFPNYAIFFVLVPFLVITVFAFIYSYFEYQKEMET